MQDEVSDNEEVLVLVEHHILDMSDNALWDILLRAYEVSEPDRQDLQNKRLSETSPGFLISEQSLMCETPFLRRV